MTVQGFFSREASHYNIHWLCIALLIFTSYLYGAGQLYYDVLYSVDTSLNVECDVFVLSFCRHLSETVAFVCGAFQSALCLDKF